MEVQNQREALEAALVHVPLSLQPRFRSVFEELVTRYAALPAQDPGKETIEREIEQLQRDAVSARQEGGSWSTWARISLTVGIVGVIVLYGLYFAYLPSDKYASIEGTRPILVFTLIISMLGFGGVLIAAALYGARTTTEDFENRFRMAREIFLVFAGIFGTIIGFYFGAADEEAGNEAPAVEVAFSEGRVTAAVSGGSGPFLGILTLKGESSGRLMAVEERMLSYEVADCPALASVVVVDGRGRRAESQVKCGGGASGNVTPPGDAGAGNAVDGNATGNQL